MTNRILPLLLLTFAPFLLKADEGTNTIPKPPGVVINHSPASSGLYIGSPSIAVLTNGDYVASHDFFGPQSKEEIKARTLVFRSSDKGNTWKKASEIHVFFPQVLLNIEFQKILFSQFKQTNQNIIHCIIDTRLATHNFRWKFILQQ